MATCSRSDVPAPSSPRETEPLPIDCEDHHSDNRRPGERRIPFHYYGYEGTRSSIKTVGRTNREEDSSANSLSIRYRLFNRLDPGGDRLRMPDHIVPPEFFSILPFDDFVDESGKQSSIVTIFTIWNTMMGTSLIALPWAVHQAGFAFGIFLILFMAAIAFYTAYRVVESPSSLISDVTNANIDFSDVCRYYWGKAGSTVAVSFSIIVLVGGVLVYWVLMSNFLFATGNVVHEMLQKNSSIIPIMENNTFRCDIYCPETRQSIHSLTSSPSSTTDKHSFLSYANLWQLQGTVPVYLAILTLPVLNFRSPSFFTKFNMLGTLSVIYLIIFVSAKGYECGLNISFSDSMSIHYVENFRWKFPALTGTLALSFFIHNAILTILRTQRNPENNGRDLFIGYALATSCYVFIGTIFYSTFPTVRSCIADNLLNNFGTGDVMSAIARMFLLLQMLSVFPLLIYFIRIQLFHVLFEEVYPGLMHVLILNLLILTLAILIAMFYPHVGGILRYIGSFVGVFYLFALPCAVYMMKLKAEGRLTKFQVVIHGALIAFGCVNFFSQFLIH